MKALYTYWSKPIRENLARCNNEKNFIMMFIYSMLWSAKWFDKVELNTDNYGYNIFKYFETDKIRIKNTLNNFENLDAYLFWAYPKIYSLALQDEPFIHLDGDIFIFKKLRDNIFEGDFAFQNLEKTYYERTYSELVNFCDVFFNHKPKEWNPRLNSAINCGLMYFKDPDLAKLFHDNCYKYFIDLDYFLLEKIKKELKQIINIKYITYPLIFEQYYLNCFINSFKDKKVSYLLTDNEIEREEKGQPCIEGYIHLIEDKNNPVYLSNIERRFSLEFPYYYQTFLRLK